MDFESGRGVGRGVQLLMDAAVRLACLSYQQVRSWTEDEKAAKKAGAVSLSLLLPNLRAFSSFESAHGRHGLAQVENIVRK